MSDLCTYKHEDALEPLTENFRKLWIVTLITVFAPLNQMKWKTVFFLLLIQFLLHFFPFRHPNPKKKKKRLEHHRLLLQGSTVYLALSCCLQDACLLGDVYLCLCKIYNWNRSTVEQSRLCFIALPYHPTQELLRSSNSEISNSILSTP